MAKNTSGQRIQIKTTLAQAVQLIASDKIQDTSTKPARWRFIPSEPALKILIKLVAPDPNQGWKLLRMLDTMNVYGKQIPLAFDIFSLGEKDLFIRYVLEGNSAMTHWIDKQLEKGSDQK